MSKVVLDASAVTAVLRKEPGHQNVLPHLRGSLISAVNLAEVFCTARSYGSLPEMDQQAIQMMQLTSVAFDESQSQIVASIYQQTRGGSVGIADRACLALGILHDLPVLTGDHEWTNYDVGVEVQLFRQRSKAPA